MDNPPYDPVKDFAPIAVIGVIPIAIAVHPSIAGSLQKLIENVKAKPGKYSYSSSGVGGINHFSGELFKKQAGGLDILHIPYRGSAPGVQSVIAGQLPIAVSAFSAVGPHHLSGKLRILAVFSERRSVGAPDIPTAIELGVPAMLAYTLDAIFAPASTPKPIIDRLYQATSTVMADKAFQKELETIGIDTDERIGIGLGPSNIPVKNRQAEHDKAGDAIHDRQSASFMHFSGAAHCREPT